MCDGDSSPFAFLCIFCCSPAIFCELFLVVRFVNARSFRQNFFFALWNHRASQFRFFLSDQIMLRAYFTFRNYSLRKVNQPAWYETYFICDFVTFNHSLHFFCRIIYFGNFFISYVLVDFNRLISLIIFSLRRIARKRENFILVRPSSLDDSCLTIVCQPPENRRFYI